MFIIIFQFIDYLGSDNIKAWVNGSVTSSKELFISDALGRIFWEGGVTPGAGAGAGGVVGCGWGWRSSVRNRRCVREDRVHRVTPRPRLRGFSEILSGHVWVQLPEHDAQFGCYEAQDPISCVSGWSHVILNFPKEPIGEVRLNSAFPISSNDSL